MSPAPTPLACRDLCAGGVGIGWRDQYDAHFTGADVVIIPDNDADDRGAALRQSIAGHLVKVARGCGC